LLPKSQHSAHLLATQQSLQLHGVKLLFVFHLPHLLDGLYQIVSVVFVFIYGGSDTKDVLHGNQLLGRGTSKFLQLQLVVLKENIAHFLVLGLSQAVLEGLVLGISEQQLCVAVHHCAQVRILLLQDGLDQQLLF
jgi:hypothetical protein